MWLMPSYGRPERLRELLDAPGGWPQSVVVLVNQDDPERKRYQQINDQLRHEGRDAPWLLRWLPPGSRCADAHREIMALQPKEPFYGLLCDDQWPITPGWHEALVAAAGDFGISTPAGEPSFPKLRNALVIGGELARAMGSLVPAPVKHNFEDNIWDDVAAEFGLLRPCQDIIVEHRHWIRNQAQKDATYERGSADFAVDEAIYRCWLKSPEKAAMNQRIAERLGATVTTLDPKAIKLAILTPLKHELDIAYHNSIMATVMDLQRAKVRVMSIPAEGCSNPGLGRAGLLLAAMKTDATHFLWIDSDMGWEPEQVRNLLCVAEHHEFVGIPGVRKDEKAIPCAVMLPEVEQCPKTGFLSVESVGFAFVMMRRSVVEKMQAAYPELEYSVKDGTNFALFCEFIDKGDKRIGPKGSYLSEDVAFCRRWRAIGGEIWVDPHASLIHAGRKEYTGSIASHSQAALERQRVAGGTDYAITEAA